MLNTFTVNYVDVFQVFATSLICVGEVFEREFEMSRAEFGKLRQWKKNKLGRSWMRKLFLRLPFSPSALLKGFHNSAICIIYYAI